MERVPFFSGSGVATALAPMQDITDAGFMKCIECRGAPDFYVAEYFRIHEYYCLGGRVLESVLWNPERVCAQFIGGDVSHIARAVSELGKFPQIKMLDLNLGCPAPKVYRKNVGGGLLKSPEKISEILKAMRSEWGGILSVKMRTGFDSDAGFEKLFDTVVSCGPDFVTVHARTVKQLYRGTPNYSCIAKAVKMCDIPIIANGDIESAQKAFSVVKNTGCAGVMCGRHAVRNPWIFRQIRETFAGIKPFVPKLSDVRAYIDDICAGIFANSAEIKFPDSRLKKFLNFIGASVDSEGKFLYKMRRATGIAALLKVCDEFMLDNSNAGKPYPAEPYNDICSRPNHEL